MLALTQGTTLHGIQHLGLAGPAQRRATCSSPSVAAQRRAGRPAAAAAAGGSSTSSGGGSSARGRGRLVVTAAVKVSKGKQVLCNKVLKAKEGRGPEVQALCDSVAAFSKQRMADRSAGILAFEVSEDDFDKGTFHFLELYSAQRCMTDHNNSPEIKQFVDQVQPHLEGPMGMVLYEYTNGKIGPASMEGGVKGEGGLDDATGTNRFGGGASMKQTSATVDLTRFTEKDDEEKGLWGIKGLKFELPWQKKTAEKKAADKKASDKQAAERKK